MSNKEIVRSVGATAPFFGVASDSRRQKPLGIDELDVFSPADTSGDEAVLDRLCRSLVPATTMTDDEEGSARARTVRHVNAMLAAAAAAATAAHRHGTSSTDWRSS